MEKEHTFTIGDEKIELEVRGHHHTFCFARYYKKQDDGTYKKQRGRKLELHVYENKKGKFVNLYGKRVYL